MKKWIFTLIFSLSALSIAGFEMTPIQQKDTGIETITRTVVAQIFLGKQRFFHGIRITPYSIALDNLQTKLFFIRNLGSSPEMFAQQNSELINSGRDFGVTIVESTTEMLVQVAKKPGNLGFLSETVMAMNVNSYVKTFQIVE